MVAWFGCLVVVAWFRCLVVVVDWFGSVAVVDLVGRMGDLLVACWLAWLALVLVERARWPKPA